jgi:hypothetical protein
MMLDRRVRFSALKAWARRIGVGHEMKKPPN